MEFSEEFRLSVSEDANVETVRSLFEEATHLYVRYVLTHRKRLVAVEEGWPEASLLELNERDYASAHVAYCMCISKFVGETDSEVMRASRAVGKRALAEL